MTAPPKPQVPPQRVAVQQPDGVLALGDLTGVYRGRCAVRLDDGRSVWAHPLDVRHLPAEWP